MKPSAEKKALITELDSQRKRVASDLGGLNDSLDFQQRFEDSVRRHPGWWIGGGIAGGIVLSRLLFPGRRGGSGKAKSGGSLRSSAFLGLLGIAGKEILRLSTPALKEAASQQLDEWIHQRRSPSPGPEAAEDEFQNENAT